MDASLPSRPTPSRGLLRSAARLRPFFRVLLLLSPTLVVVGFDLWRRGERIEDFDVLHRLTYAASIVESAIVWGVVLLAASRRRGWARWLFRVLFVSLFTIALGGQAYFFQQYRAYLNVEVSRFATNFVESVLNQLWADAGNYAVMKLPALAVALTLLAVSCAWVRPSAKEARWSQRWAGAALLLTFVLPTQHQRAQAATPDVLYLHAMGGMLQTQLGLSDESQKLRPRARESLPVPPLERGPAPPRNVVLVILESVRADAYCVDYEPGCRVSAATNELLPHRFPLRQLRALDSSTAISVAVLWSGVGPHESREVLHTWPLLFDYARAAGYWTAFWTSQNMMFGNSRLWVQNLGVDSFFHATEVDPTSDIDMGAPERLFVDRAIAELPRMAEPFFVTVQLSNVHAPYQVDETEPQPFQPSGTSKAPEDNPKLFNHYKNAVHQQDRQLARLLEAIRRSPAGERTVIVTTSDHGEAFREHDQMGHTFSLFDEEVRVPGYVDAPPGTLSDEEARELRQRADAFVTHPDITATVIDLFGVWGSPELARFKQKMLGASLLREAPPPRVLPLTNCSGVWSCAFENWGVLQGSRKLAARAWDPDYRCYDLIRDPEERRDLGPEACLDLRQYARDLFGRLPGGPK